MLDASFLVKLVVEEEGSAIARRLIRSWARAGEPLATVDIALPEALNALWKHCVKLGDLARSDAVEAAEDLLKLWRVLRVYPSHSLAAGALELAVDEGIPVYDALYLHLAESEGAGLATFDEKLAKIAAGRGVAVYP